MKERRPEPSRSDRGFFFPCALRKLQLGNEARAALGKKTRGRRGRAAAVHWGRRRISGRKIATRDSSAPPPHRAVMSQRAGTHPDPRSQRWRHVVKRRATTLAGFLRNILSPQPVAPLHALRIQTLHRPTGHVLHRQFASPVFCAGGRRGSKLAAEIPV